MKVHIVDNGLSNVGSIVRMLNQVGTDSLVTNEASELRTASKLILPGVGHFSSGSDNLDALGLRDIIMELGSIRRIPILGICLGMQLLFESSEESDDGKPGLGLLAGFSTKINSSKKNCKTPHMGWNNVITGRESRLLNGVQDPRFYFVHSYHVIPKDPKIVVGKTTYGDNLTAVVERDNLMGTQFHPEKSHQFGLKLFHNFTKF